MDDKQQKPINLDRFMKHPVTMPLAMALGIFVAGWVGQPLIIERLSDYFFTKTEAAEFTDGLDDRMVKIEKGQVITNGLLNDLGVYVKTSNAYNTVRDLEADLAKHLLNRSNTAAWAMENSKLTQQARLAQEYKDCVLNSKPRCAFIQEQIWK